MKLSEFENQYKEFASQQESESKVVNQADKARVWDKVQLAMPAKRRSIPAWTLVAASVLLLVVSYLSFDGIQQRNAEIARLQEEVQQMKSGELRLQEKYKNVSAALTDLQNLPPRIDTVYKTKVVYQDREVYVEREPQIAENSYPKSGEPRNYISMGDEMIDLASLEDVVESIKIQYGQKNSTGQSPWSFTVTYQ